MSIDENDRIPLGKADSQVTYVRHQFRALLPDPAQFKKCLEWLRRLNAVSHFSAGATGLTIHTSDQMAVAGWITLKKGRLLNHLTWIPHAYAMESIPPEVLHREGCQESLLDLPSADPGRTPVESSSQEDAICMVIPLDPLITITTAAIEASPVPLGLVLSVTCGSEPALVLNLLDGCGDTPAQIIIYDATDDYDIPDNLNSQDIARIPTLATAPVDWRVLGGLWTLFRKSAAVDVSIVDGLLSISRLSRPVLDLCLGASVATTAPEIQSTTIAEEFLVWLGRMPDVLEESIVHILDHGLLYVTGLSDGLEIQAMIGPLTETEME